MNNACLPKGKFFQGIVFLFTVVVCNLLGTQVYAQSKLYSRGTGNWNSNTNWSTTSHAGASCSCTPGDLLHAGYTIEIGNNHTITYQSTTTGVTIPALVINDDGNGGTLVFGNGGTATTLTISGDLTINSNGTLRSGATGATSHTISVGGDLNDNGTLDLTLSSAANQTLTFNTPLLGTNSIQGAATTINLYNMNVSGSGTLLFGDNTATSRTLSIANDLTIGRPFQSGATGTVQQTIQLAGSLINNSSVDFTANSATNHALTFNGAAAENIRGSGSTITVYNMNVTGTGALSFGDNAAVARTLNISNDLTIGASSTLQSGATAGNNHKIAAFGNIINDGTFNLTANTATSQSLVFSGGTTSTVSGAGTFAFRNVTMSTTSSSNVSLTSSISISNTLSFTSNGLLTLDANSNITLGSAATITGFNNSRYIQVSGGTGANSNLIKTSSGATASWQITYPIGTSNGGYSPLVLPTVGGTAPTSGSTISVTAIFNASIQGQLRRTFRIVVAGNAVATTFSGPQFNYNTTVDVSGGDALSNYSTLWYLSKGVGTWTSIAGAAPGAGTFTVTTPGHNLVTGTYYYTIGASDAYPNTWYSYQTGVWSDWQNWTLDPSGTTLVNGLNLPPQPGDEIVILNGITITNDFAGQVASSTTIQSGATLDMVATAGNTLGTVSGAGLLRLQGVNLPSGTYTSFVAVTGGTIEYYNTGGTLPSQAVYNKLILSNSSTTSDATFITANNLTINGTLNISQTGTGHTVTWQINDNTSTNRTITVAGDLTVSSGGKITAGTGNAGVTIQHSLTLSGNFTNNGVVQFFDPTDVTYSNARYNYNFTSDPLPLGTLAGTSVYLAVLRGNAINVTFSGATDNTVSCNGQTDFYRLIVNKGTGQQALLTLNSTAISNMRLFGPANLNGLTPGPSNNALSIQNGTLQLTGTLTIPLLCANGAGALGNDYTIIPQSGGLWINGAAVKVVVANSDTNNDDQRLLCNGLLRVTAGSLISGYGRGLGSGTGGTLMVEGGSVATWQYRPLLGSTNVSYIQTGGTVNIGTTGYNSTAATNGITDGTTASYARFSIPSSTSTFQMSGGTLNIGTPSQNSTGAEGIDIQSSSGNFSVTGGTINAYIPNSGTFDFGINSTSSFYNLNIYREGTSVARTATIAQGTVILNNLTLVTGNAPTLNCGGQDLTVGGNFDIQTGAILLTGANTITLNGSAAQSWNNNGTINKTTATANPALMGNIIVNKSAGTVTLNGTGSFPGSSAITTGSMTGLTLTSGTLADNGKTLTVTSTLSNSATHSGSGSIVANGPTAIGGSNGTFGNLTISTNGAVSTSGDQSVTGNVRLTAANSTLNIQSNGLTVLGGIYDAATGTTTAGFSTTKRIQTAGLRNDSGLTRQAVSGTDLLFPFGVTSPTAYTPASINVTATTAGKVTMRPVTGVHPTATPTAQGLQYYWRVTSSGFVGVSTVVHKSYTFSSASLLQGTLTAYKPARYDAATFTWTLGTTYNATSSTVIFPSTGNFSFGTNIDGEYTAGNITAGVIAVFYSRQTGNWNDNNTWSVTPCSGTGVCGTAVTSGLFPSSTSAVVIGNLNNSHTVTIDADSRTCGTLYIENTSKLDCGTHISLNFGINTSQTVNGRGTLRIAAVTAGVGVFPGGDFTNFIGPTGGTIEWYGASKTLPTTGPSGLVLDNYYNLILNPTSGQTITLPPSNLTIYNTLTQNGAGTVSTDKTALTTRTITLNGNFDITAGTFSVVTNTAPNANTALSGFVLSGDLSIASGASFAVSGGTATHAFTTSGNITNNGVLDFKNGSVMNATFTGTANTSLGGTTATVTDLNNVIVNKGTSQTPTLTVSVNAITTITTAGAVWLTLTNGTINFNNSATYVISSATSAYSIPSTAKLKTQAGIVSIVSAANDNADVLLGGAIEVAGGTVNIGSGGNNNNDIEYASAGSPTIIVSGGIFNVTGAVRRPTLTLSGALVYNQSGGTATISGRNCAGSPENTRGIFEIENNAGSNFTFTGGTLNVQRSTSGSSFADLYINPETSSVSASSILNFGMNTNTAVSSTLSINIVPAVGNFNLLGTTTAQTFNMLSSALTTLGTLSIASNSTLNTNALDVNIGGDLSSLGTYNGTILTGNTTTFNGSGAQSGTLTGGSTTFQNITIDKPSGTATLSGTTSINNLNILNGILSVSGTLNINGDITNNSTQIGAGTINFLGTGTTTAHTINSTVGSFTNLSLGGTASTKKITLNGNLTIDGVLDFTTSGTSRYFFIGSNQLTFSQTGTVSNDTTARFIRTNGVSSDLGVVKNWKTGSSLTFKYAVGTRTNYTPVKYSLNVNNAGDITVIPVDDQHPTANATGQQILNYYWIVKRSSSLALSNNTGRQHYQFPTSLIGGSGGTAIAAHLDAINLIGWTASPGNGGAVNANSPTSGNTTLLFTSLLNTNFPTAGGEFHYTEGTTNTLPNPVTPVYSRFADADGVSNPTSVSNLSTGGNWNLATNWTLSATGNGTAVSTVPAGRPIVILPGARMNMNISGLSAFTSQINGLMVITSTAGHNLGSISGTGTLRTSVSTLPAGNYTTFVSSAGGTIEYAAPITMNSRASYNNLSITATGSVAMTNTDLTLNGSLTIASTATLDNSSFDRTISIAKDWTNNGTFTAGTGTVIFDGTTTQNINGSTDFYNLTTLKSGNLTLAGTAATTVNNTLTLTTGYVIASSANPLIMGTSATISGGSVTSFVDGPVKRTIGSGSTFTYPLGSTSNFQYRPATIFGTSASDVWTLKYVGHDPSSDSYSHKTMNISNLGKVSMFEYWDISRASSTSASVTLSYNTGSYIPSVVGTVANLRIAHWDGTQWDLPTGGGAFSQSGTTTSGTVTITNVTSFSPFTLGSLDTTSPLPVKWLSFTAERNGASVLLNWKTAMELNNDHFEIERSDDGLTFNPIGSKLAVGNSNTPQSYQFTDKEVSKTTQYYYRVKQVDVDGAVDYSTVVVVNAIAEKSIVKNNWIGLPNPLNDSQNFQIVLNETSAANNNAPVHLQVITSGGIVLFQGEDVLDKLNTQIENLFHTVSTGIYIIQISDGTNQQLFRVARY